MTFSLIGRSPDGRQVGVAVASKFLAVGAYVTAANAEAGAIATQAYGNQALKSRGLELLRSGLAPQAMLDSFLADDPRKDQRQIGVVSIDGQAVTYTGTGCLPWAGGQAGTHPAGSYAAQGNMLAGPAVIDAMVSSWLSSKSETNLAQRLVTALDAGQTAGGDPRGKQAAAVLVVSKGGGYEGLSDVVVDLRSDDSAEPIEDLMRMLKVHELYFGKTPADQLIDLTAVDSEICQLLARLHFGSGDIAQDLSAWMGRENYEERWYDGKIDPVVLAELRRQAG